MTYTNNVPQATQTIAFTQPLIQSNFSFLENSIGQEHNFDSTDATKTYHKQASMPNRADPVGLPAATNGMFYVSSGLPKFYDGTNSWTLNQWRVITATAFNTPNNSSEFTIAALPAVPLIGTIYMYGGTGSNLLMESGQFWSDGTKVYGFNNRIVLNGSSNDSPIELVNNPSTNNALRAFVSSSTFQNKSYIYFIAYR